jgi:hypothetical protein
MGYSEEVNVLTSNFVMGCLLPTDNNIECVDSLNKWIVFKDSDWTMKNKNTDRTKYISFLHIIALPILKEIVIDLAKIYRKQYPYGEKNDFIEYYFDYTLIDIDRIANRDYTFYGTPPTIPNHEFYYWLEQPANEFLDFAIPTDQDIENYKQYFRKVIQFLNELDYKKASRNNDLEISIKLIGLGERWQDSLNDLNTTSPVFQHIDDILIKYDISRLEATAILLKMKGTYPPKMNKNVVNPIIQYLKSVDNLKTSVTKTDKLIFENNFDWVEPKKIIDHFHEGLVTTKMLSEEDLLKFLIAAFEIKSTPKERFVLINTVRKSKVREVFYNYYKNVAGKIHGEQIKYASLLGEFFQGYNTDSVSTNFTK